MKFLRLKTLITISCLCFGNETLASMVYWSKIWSILQGMRMVEVNSMLARLKEFSGRIESLRGYLWLCRQKRPAERGRAGTFRAHYLGKSRQSTGIRAWARVTWSGRCDHRVFFFLFRRRPRSTSLASSAASDVYKRQRLHEISCC